MEERYEFLAACDRLREFGIEDEGQVVGVLEDGTELARRPIPDTASELLIVREVPGDRFVLLGVARRGAVRLATLRRDAEALLGLYAQMFDAKEGAP